MCTKENKNEVVVKETIKNLIVNVQSPARIHSFIWKYKFLLLTFLTDWMMCDSQSLYCLAWTMLLLLVSSIDKSRL